MADLIDRDAVLAEIGEFQIRFNETGDSHERVAYASAEHCMLVIKAAPAVNRWISVEDALPEQDGFYLAYFTFKDGTHATDIAYINTGCNLGSITHWMPMPEPPEVDKQ